MHKQHVRAIAHAQAHFHDDGYFDPVATRRKVKGRHTHTCTRMCMRTLTHTHARTRSRAHAYTRARKRARLHALMQTHARYRAPPLCHEFLAFSFDAQPRAEAISKLKVFSARSCGQRGHLQACASCVMQVGGADIFLLATQKYPMRWLIKNMSSSWLR